MTKICNHTKTRIERSLEVVYDRWEDECREEVVENEVEYNTYQDLGKHRYFCTQCKEVFYYSEAARKYYEEGIKSSIEGLDE